MAYQGYKAVAEQIGRLIFRLLNGALWIMSWGSPVSSSVGCVAWRGASRSWGGSYSGEVQVDILLLDHLYNELLPLLFLVFPLHMCTYTVSVS